MPKNFLESHNWSLSSFGLGPIYSLIYHCKYTMSMVLVLLLYLLDDWQYRCLDFDSIIFMEHDKCNAIFARINKTSINICLMPTSNNEYPIIATERFLVILLFYVFIALHFLLQIVIAHDSVCHLLFLHNKKNWIKLLHLHRVGSKGNRRYLFILISKHKTNK